MKHIKQYNESRKKWLDIDQQKKEEHSIIEAYKNDCNENIKTIKNAFQEVSDMSYMSTKFSIEYRYTSNKKSIYSIDTSCSPDYDLEISWGNDLDIEAKEYIKLFKELYSNIDFSDDRLSKDFKLYMILNFDNSITLSYQSLKQKLPVISD